MNKLARKSRIILIAFMLSLVISMGSVFAQDPPDEIVSGMAGAAASGSVDGASSQGNSQGQTTNPSSGDNTSSNETPATIESSNEQIGTILPGTAFSQGQCEQILYIVNSTYDSENNSNDIAENITLGERMVADRLIRNVGNIQNVRGNDILACGIRTGSMSFWMIPFYIRFILQFIISMAGLIAVAAIVFGGVMYLFAGLSDDKDKGKNAIKNGVIGFVITLVAWSVVNIVIALLT